MEQAYDNQFVGLFLLYLQVGSYLTVKQNYRIQSNLDLSHSFVDKHRECLFPQCGERSLKTGTEAGTKVNYL